MSNDKVMCPKEAPKRARIRSRTKKCDEREMFEFMRGKGQSLWVCFSCGLQEYR